MFRELCVLNMLFLMNRPIDESRIAEPQVLMHSNGIDMNKEEEKLLQHALWVEKYTPRYFTELLSDDVSTQLCQ